MRRRFGSRRALAACGLEALHGANVDVAARVLSEFLDGGKCVRSTFMYQWRRAMGRTAHRRTPHPGVGLRRHRHRPEGSRAALRAMAVLCASEPRDVADDETDGKWIKRVEDLCRRCGMTSSHGDHVVVVGAGLSGLAAALHLAGRGRAVTVVERGQHPGGRMGRLDVDGYRIDTGPTVLTMPDIIDDTLNAVGESLADRLDLSPVDPSYRALFADGSQLHVHREAGAMADEVARVMGSAE
ncbi:MAG: phytoene desaturase, partial [Mycobacterium sp.]|nr:phytoene desaturase [Mycobacterium sp.]